MSTQTHATLRLLALVVLLGAALWPRAGRDGRTPRGGGMASHGLTASVAMHQNR